MLDICLGFFWAFGLFVVCMAFHNHGRVDIRWHNLPIDLAVVILVSGFILGVTRDVPKLR